MLNPLKLHPFKKDDLATLAFFSDVSNEEMVFLILALSYNDLQLAPRKRKVCSYLHTVHPTDKVFPLLRASKLQVKQPGK